MSSTAMVLVLVLGIGGACSSNVGVPGYRRSTPPKLRVSAQPTPAEAVRIEFKSLPWWTIAGTNEQFILGFDESRGPPLHGQVLGALRSKDVPVTPIGFESIRCAWKIVSMGDPRPCGQMTRTDAMAMAKGPIDTAKQDLREQAGQAGTGLVAAVRCFAEERQVAAYLWCEGVAMQVSEEMLARPHGNDPTASIAHEPKTRGDRFVLHADGSVGMLGTVPIVGSTLGLRYRPYEVGLYVLDLGREAGGRGLVGVGATGIGRLGLGNTRFDGILGVSALAVARNGATNPNFDGLFHAFAGVAYQTSWRIAGAAQPFVQLRAGLARGSDLARKSTPMFELHFGLTTPERR